LILRHQLAVLQRRQPRRPKLNWADRALLATLLSVIPTARRYGLQLLVTPDTIMRWHRDIVRRRWAARSMRGKTVRAENPVHCSDLQGCSSSRPARMIIDHVPAVGLRHEALVRREALGIEGGARPPRQAVAAAGQELGAA
jgi:hypothetical protein